MSQLHSLTNMLYSSFLCLMITIRSRVDMYLDVRMLRWGLLKLYDPIGNVHIPCDMVTPLHNEPWRLHGNF